MPSIVVNFTHEAGIHCRPAAMLIQIAKNHNAKCTITAANGQAPLTDIFAVMSLAIEPGKVILDAEGPEAELALTALKAAFDSNFDDFS